MKSSEQGFKYLCGVIRKIFFETYLPICEHESLCGSGGWQFQLKLIHTQNRPNRETRIFRYVAIQIQIGILMCDVNLHRGIWVSGFGWFRGGDIFSGNCHTLSRKLFHTHQGNRWYTCSHRIRTCDLQTEEIGHKIITTAKISSIFNGSPRNFQTSFHRTFQNFKQFFTEVKGSPCHSKEWTGKLFNLEMQTF